MKLPAFVNHFLKAYQDCCNALDLKGGNYQRQVVSEFQRRF